MKFMLKSLSAITLSLSAIAAFATPTYLTTHNNTTEESNAFVAGVPSPYATSANSTRQVYWNLVKMACYGHTKNNTCAAVVKMATNTANPIVIGTLTMDLASGDITPKRLSANGYTIIVNGFGETTINKD
ncbi:hypothetical protein [Legionella sp. km772]|uniref:hypothetical protein n=1 Tax=Legionella sp. km772 TaxID=2498111 RepID=UPI000F8CA027|nr:hypothetical protein [Legionella sp. km772]RUR13898.1 hypothetical protein ELY15_01155 [Legionella sp. km772]